ncbi:protein NLP5-like [Lycium barbarum]|uniref:protein NLP5-like n=1 Tax=Lycium barbarum TaxID=112863 RepID=UPI00293F34FE|nr:protein NLP5-like [Lycium barbarum]
METLRFMNIFVLTTAYLPPTTITDQESCFSPAPDTSGGSQPTVSRTLLLFSLFIFCNYVDMSLFANTDPDALEISSDVDSEQNLFANVISNDPSIFLEFVPHELDSHNQIPLGICPLTSSELQEIESLANESREEGTTSSRPDLVEEDDHALVDMKNGLEEIEHAGNIYADEERVNIEVIDSDTLSSSDSGEIEHNNRPDNRGAETTVDRNCSRGAMRTERECGITLTDLQRHYGKKVEDAAKSLGVSRSTFKRICRANGIDRWPRKRPATSSTQSMATMFDQRDKSMSIKASYNNVNVKFPLSLSSGKKDLEVEVEKRFRIQTGSYWIKYEDEDKDWIRITCDKDLHHGMHTRLERGITTMKMLVNCDLG